MTTAPSANTPLVDPADLLGPDANGDYWYVDDSGQLVKYEGEGVEGGGPRPDVDVYTNEVKLVNPPTELIDPELAALPEYGALLTQDKLNEWIHTALVQNTIFVDKDAPTDKTPYQFWFDTKNQILLLNVVADDGTQSWQPLGSSELEGLSPLRYSYKAVDFNEFKDEPGTIGLAVGNTDGSDGLDPSIPLIALTWIEWPEFDLNTNSAKGFESNQFEIFIHAADKDSGREVTYRVDLEAQRGYRKGQVSAYKWSSDSNSIYIEEGSIVELVFVPLSKQTTENKDDIDRILEALDVCFNKTYTIEESTGNYPSMPSSDTCLAINTEPCLDAPRIIIAESVWNGGTFKEGRYTLGDAVIDLKQVGNHDHSHDDYNFSSFHYDLIEGTMPAVGDTAALAAYQCDELFNPEDYVPQHEFEQEKERQDKQSVFLEAEILALGVKGSTELAELDEKVDRVESDLTAKIDEIEISGGGKESQPYIDFEQFKVIERSDRFDYDPIFYTNPIASHSWRYEIDIVGNGGFVPVDQIDAGILDDIGWYGSMSVTHLRLKKTAEQTRLYPDAKMRFVVESDLNDKENTEITCELPAWADGECVFNYTPSQFETRVSTGLDLQDKIFEIAVQADKAIKEEGSTRQSEVSDLQHRLDELEAPEPFDPSNLENSIEAEKAFRLEGDLKLATDLQFEADARQRGDIDLQAKIDALEIPENVDEIIARIDNDIQVTNEKIDFNAEETLKDQERQDDKIEKGLEEQEKIKLAIEELQVTKGSVARYKIKATTIGAASRDGELYVMSAVAVDVQAMSFAPFDLDGQAIKPCDVDDIVEFVAPVSGEVNRYRVISGEANALTVEYLNGTHAFVVDETLEVYIYPQNAVSVSKEYVDASNALQDEKLAEYKVEVTADQDRQNEALSAESVDRIRNEVKLATDLQEESEARQRVDTDLQAQIDELELTGGGVSDVEVLNDLKDVDTSKVIDYEPILHGYYNHTNILNAIAQLSPSNCETTTLSAPTGHYEYAGEPKGGEKFRFTDYPTCIVWARVGDDSDSTKKSEDFLKELSREEGTNSPVTRRIQISRIRLKSDGYSEDSVVKEIATFKSWQVFKGQKYYSNGDLGGTYELFVLELQELTDLRREINVAYNQHTRYTSIDLERIDDTSNNAKKLPGDQLIKYDPFKKEWVNDQPDYAPKWYARQQDEILEQKVDKNKAIQDDQINAVETQIQLLANVQIAGKWKYFRGYYDSIIVPETGCFYGIDTNKPGGTYPYDDDTWQTIDLLRIDKTDLEGTIYSFTQFEPGDKVEVLATDGSSALFGTITNQTGPESYGSFTVAVERTKGKPRPQVEFLLSIYRPGAYVGNVDLDALDHRYVNRLGDTYAGILNFERGSSPTQFSISPNSGDTNTSIYGLNGGQIRFRTSASDASNNVGSHIILDPNNGAPQTKIYNVVAPTNENMAANKKYVDDNITSPTGAYKIILEDGNYFIVPTNWTP